MTSVAVLVPRRPDGGQRDRLWAFCSKWWAREHPDFDVIEGDDRAGRFNRARSLNTAKARTTADVLIAADGDVIIPPDQVEAAVKLAAETGRAVLAYEHKGYTPLTEQMTESVLGGYDGRWDTPQGFYRRERSDNHVSSCIVVPRALWERVGGYDERVEGWGPEDRIFHAMCRVLGGGVARVPGKVFHLWHPFSPERTQYKQSTDWKAGKAIWDHVSCLVTPAEMDRHVTDSKVADGVLVVFVGNGRGDCLERAVESFQRHLSGPVVRMVIVDDSGDIDHHAWIRLNFPGIDLVATRGKTGFDGAYQKVWETVAGYAMPWAFVIEEDFTTDRTIDLAAMQQAMDANPHLCQMALRRQAWFPKELEVGGVVELNPDGYTDTPTHLEHREFVTTNPALWRRSFVTHHPWPKGAHSEHQFTRHVFADPTAVSGYWGQRTDAPWVTHDGQRQGARY